LARRSLTEHAGCRPDARYRRRPAPFLSSAPRRASASSIKAGAGSAPRWPHRALPPQAPAPGARVSPSPGRSGQLSAAGS
jgi:hypothetical protein